MTLGCVKLVNRVHRSSFLRKKGPKIFWITKFVTVDVVPYRILKGTCKKRR